MKETFLSSEIWKSNPIQSIQTPAIADWRADWLWINTSTRLLNLMLLTPDVQRGGGWIGFWVAELIASSSEFAYLLKGLLTKFPWYWNGGYGFAYPEGSEEESNRSIQVILQSNQANSNVGNKMIGQQTLQHYNEWFATSFEAFPWLVDLIKSKKSSVNNSNWEKFWQHFPSIPKTLRSKKKQCLLKACFLWDFYFLPKEGLPLLAKELVSRARRSPWSRGLNAARPLLCLRIGLHVLLLVEGRAVTPRQGTHLFFQVLLLA